MSESPSYRNAFYLALIFHMVLGLLLVLESTNSHPVLKSEAKNSPGATIPITLEKADQAVKAVSVDSHEVMETVNRLKAERLHQQQAEQQRQRTLTKQAEAARRQRIHEQQQLEKLKAEATKLALAQEKKLAEQQQHLKELALKKQVEEKRLDDMKKQQDSLLKKQQADAEKAAALAKEKAAAQKTQEDLAKKQAAEQQASLDAQRKAQLSGEVDKYKALIINAISQRWILPENANRALSSQFRIRLAPNGAVLEVSLTRSSGDPILDRSAQAAIYKASPLPVPSDASTFNLFRDISLTVRPENVRG